jgi:hypothetical protein
VRPWPFRRCLDGATKSKDEVELAVKDESELLLVGLHVERRGPSSFGLVTIPRLHEFADGGLDKLLRFAVLGFCCISAIL